jgi:hypothetical protein
VLPAGNSMDHYTMTICIRLTDGATASSYAFFPAVRVTPSTNSAEDILNAVSNVTAMEKLANNNPSSFISYAYAVISTINPPSNALVSNTTSRDAGQTCSTTAPIITTTMSPQDAQAQQTAQAVCITVAAKTVPVWLFHRR